MPLPTLPKIAGLKKFMPIIVALALGIVAMVLMNSYMQKKAQEEKERLRVEQENKVGVVFAKQNIAAGAKITEGMLAEAVVNKNELQPYAAGSIDKVVGKVAKIAIAEGEQIQLSKIDVPYTPKGIIYDIPEGKKALQLKADEASMMGGLLKKGYRVDIIGVMPMPVMEDGVRKGLTQEKSEVTLYQDIEILNVGEDKKGSSVIVALTPEQINIVSFVQDNAKIKLQLRSAKEPAREGGSSETNWDKVFKAIKPEIYEPSLPDTAAKNRVEIYRGRQKEIKYIDLNKK